VYLKPFGYLVWLFLLVILALCAIFLVYILNYIGFTGSGLILLFSILLEHACHIRKELLQVRTFNIFLTVFAFMGIVLTNGYKGIVITDITARLKVNPISNFQDASAANYTIVTPNPRRRNWMLIAFRYNDTKGINKEEDTFARDSLYFECVHEFGPKLFLDKSNFDNILSGTLEFQNDSMSTERLQLYKSIQEMMVTWAEQFWSILINGTDYEFLKCNKTILVDTAEVLEKKFIEMNELINSAQYSRNMTLHLANDNQFKEEWGLQMYPHQRFIMKLLLRKTSSFLSSGIYNQFAEMKKVSVKRFQGQTKERLANPDPSPLNLNTNILTVFAIYFACIGIPVVCINIELIYFYFTSLIRSYRNRTDNNITNY